MDFVVSRATGFGWPMRGARFAIVDTSSTSQVERARKSVWVLQVDPKHI